MNRSKRLGILLGVLAVVCLLTFGVSRYQQRQEDIKTSGETILEIPADSVQAVSWDNETQALSFHKDDTYGVSPGQRCISPATPCWNWALTTWHSLAANW